MPGFISSVPALKPVKRVETTFGQAAASRYEKSSTRIAPRPAVADNASAANNADNENRIILLVGTLLSRSYYSPILFTLYRMYRFNSWILAIFFCASAFAQPGPPQGILVDLLRRPDLTVITDPHPRFSWIVNDPARGAVQSAYQILVTPAETTDHPLWDSGKTASSQSIAVAYSGKPLVPNSHCWIRIRTWDGSDQASPWSEPILFNTGSFDTKRNWPGESNWVEFEGIDGAKHWTLEDRHPVEYHPIAPVSVQQVQPNDYFIDFGRAAFATLRITLTSPAEGTVVQILLGEKKTVQNHVDPHPGGSIYFGSHRLTLHQGTHTYDLSLPRHISKMPHSLLLPQQMPEVEPYRYAEVISAPSEIHPEDARQLALFYLFDDHAASFTSSDPHLNAVWDLCEYTLKAAPFLGTYIDGVRERMPYEADDYIESLGHYCLDREYAIQRYSAEFLDYHATWPTEWILQSVLIAYADYLNTGDDASLRRNYDTLKAKLLLPLENEDGLISTRTGKVSPAVLASIHYNGKAIKDVVDWPQDTESDGYVFGKYNTVVNAFHYRALTLMSEIAGATGHAKDASDFHERAEKVKAIFNRVFFDPATGLYTDGQGIAHSSLHANAFPLAFGLVPVERVPMVVKFLKSRGMACGPYGAQFLLDALYRAHEGQDALALLTSDTDRSWLNMIRSGSTMTTEAWDAKYKKNLTWNHAWGAAPANIIPRDLMGVQPLEPGFGSMRIEPQPGALGDASLRLPTIRGSVNVAYHRSAEQVRLDVTIPANTTAEVHVPTSDPGSIRESNVVPNGESGILILGATVFKVGGGTYHFAAMPTKSE